MQPSTGSGESDNSEHHIVHADEIDQTGSDISAVPDEELMPELVEEFNAENARKPEDEEISGLPQRHARPPARPELRRDQVAPPPPMKPPPPAPGQAQIPESSTDSLSLSQLKRLVHEIPKADEPAYAFQYADSQPFPEELDEWFQYNEADRLMLLGSKVTFEQSWSTFAESHSNQTTTAPSWLESSKEMRTSFVKQVLSCFDNPDLFTRIEALEIICYALTGIWGVTAGLVADDYPEDLSEQEVAECPKNKSLQIQWIEKNVLLLHKCAGIPALFEYLRQVLDRDPESFSADQKIFESENGTAAYYATKDRETNLIFTCVYVVVEVARRQVNSTEECSLRDEIASLKPNIPVVLFDAMARLRWDDCNNVPMPRTVVLFWKCILLLFGGSKELERAKTTLEPKYKGQDDPSQTTPVLTASPLDYHIFRQEITSKYPAYNPPPPLFSFEPENNSILPPLPHHSSRFGSSAGVFPGPGSSSSILHQSVHIATPAPSPPPSPIGPGGKAGKKQNYQTNQNFPFMYPPMDENSNNIGGKGTGGQQDQLVEKEWKGGHVPASIIEAGQLFSSRMKMTRAIRQLWEERERFMKYDRGWDAKESGRRDDDGEGDEAANSGSGSSGGDESSPPEKETDDPNVQRQLDAVEDFYSQAMPNLQSVVIVLLKEILASMTDSPSQADGHGQPGNHQNGGVAMNGAQMPNSQETECEADVDEDLANTRQKEISMKAISGSLILLLKWFKRSHILKFEYMTQLLLDSNFLPLILKMFIQLDVDKTVAQRNDRDDLSFFHFCHLHSNQPPAPILSPESEEPDSEDEAVPPPILRHSRSHVSVLDSSGSAVQSDTKAEQQANSSESSARPEVDELGYLTNPSENGPITTYSFRNFFSAINFLHIMQKITRDKAHRCLLLVQYKSTNILRKGIKIPDPHLRLYTLKLVKSQVPYCGRKWRQSHMRIITAIYLYCRPELRDDWLAGSDVDAEVEESLPMEQALRGLTHWWHLRQYKDAMAIEDNTMLEEERDFFSRELESMGWGMADEMAGGDLEEGELIPPLNGSESDNVPLQMEGLWQS